MKFLLAIPLMALIFVGCSTALHANKTDSNTGSEESAASTISPGPIGTGGTATETLFAGEASTKIATTESKPMVITVRPPRVPVLTAVSLAGWRTFTSAALGVAVDYPSDWSAAEQADVVTFSSPQGLEIQLQAIKASNSTDTGLNDLQCVLLINSYGLSVDTCVDIQTRTYFAKFTVKSNTGLSQPLSLSTTNNAAMGIYTQMLDSLRQDQ